MSDFIIKGTTLQTKIDRLKKFPIKKIADAGKESIQSTMELFGFQNLPKHLYTEVLEENKLAKIDVDNGLIDNTGKSFGNVVSTASFRGTAKVRDVIGFQNFGTITHKVAPITVKALHWGGNPGFFSKGHDVLGITAKNFWGLTEKVKEALRNATSKFLKLAFKP